MQKIDWDITWDSLGAEPPDAVSVRVTFLTHGRITSQGIKPHTDLLVQFPLLGVHNPSDSPRATSSSREL